MVSGRCPAEICIRAGLLSGPVSGQGGSCRRGMDAEGGDGRQMRGENGAICAIWWIRAAWPKIVFMRFCYAYGEYFD